MINKIEKMKADLNSVSITGMSFILKDKCCAVGRKMRLPCSGAKDACHILEAQGFLKGQPKNWGRFDQVSLTTYAAALWACADAGLPFAQGKRRAGIIGFNQQGAMDSNQAFFADYVNAGRNSARSNLFVYTLPTTPLAEVALFCGFTGPVWYMYQSFGGMGRVIEEAALCVLQDDVELMLAICADSQEAVCFVVQKSNAKELFPFSFVGEHLKGMTSVREILQALDMSSEGAGAL
jgi:hypothetical protein